MQKIERQFKDKLVVLSIHSPEFAHERNKANLKNFIAEKKITHPIYLDNDNSYFRRISAKGWPSIFLVDRAGLIRFIYLGETHSDFSQAQDIEQKLGFLLAGNIP